MDETSLTYSTPYLYVYSVKTYNKGRILCNERMPDIWPYLLRTTRLPVIAGFAWNAGFVVRAGQLRLLLVSEYATAPENSISSDLMIALD